MRFTVTASACHRLPKLGVLALLLIGVTTSACSLSKTLPVNGLVQLTNETFVGSATGYMDGSGTVDITSSRGVACHGDFVYVTKRQGEGVFQCDDGRSGPFSFVSTGSRGTGTGTLGTDAFTFTFGP